MSFTPTHSNTPGRSLIPFHDVLTNVSHLANDARLIMDEANLNWRAVKVPLLMQGNQENRPYGSYAIVNSKTGVPIDGGQPVTASFKSPENLAVIQDMVQFAINNELTIDYVGALDGGRMVVAHAKHPAQGDISKAQNTTKNRDFIEAGVMMVASHESGKSSKWLPHANRYVCSNGMVFGDHLGAMAYRLPHRGKSYDSASVKKVFTSMMGHFEKYGYALKTLANTPSTVELNRAYLMEMSQPNLFKAVLAETAERMHVAPDKYTANRSYYLEALTSQKVVQDILLSNMQQSGSRTFFSLLDLCANQPGAEFVRGSIAEPFHALTYWTNHIRGHQSKPDAAVEQTLMGEGANLMREGLETAREYAGWVSNASAVGVN